MDRNISGNGAESGETEKQIAAELSQLQKHLMQIYGDQGLWNKELHDELRELGRRKGDYKDAELLLMGMVMRNAIMAKDPKDQEFVDGAVTEGAFTANAVASMGNTQAARRKAREFLGLAKPVFTEKAEPSALPGIPGSQPALASNLSPASSQQRREPGAPVPADSKGRSHSKAGQRPNKVKNGASAAPASANPFFLENSDLKRQAILIERNPGLAQQLILAAGRDPKQFGFV
ncbi:hypothetical protein [Roseibium sp. M-1]